MCFGDLSPLVIALVFIIVFLFWLGEKFNRDARKGSILKNNNEPLLSTEDEEEDLKTEISDNPLKQGLRKGLHGPRRPIANKEAFR